MKLFFAVFFVLGTSLAHSGPHEYDNHGHWPPTGQEMFTNVLVFQKTLAEFKEHRKQHVGPAGLDWDADGCSHASDQPFGWYCKYIKRAWLQSR